MEQANCPGDSMLAFITVRQRSGGSVSTECDGRTRPWWELRDRTRSLLRALASPRWPHSRKKESDGFEPFTYFFVSLGVELSEGPDRGAFEFASVHCLSYVAKLHRSRESYDRRVDRSPDG